MKNPASAGIDARCCYFVRAMVGYRGISLDPGRTSDDQKLTVLEVFGPSDKVSVWIADRLGEDPTCNDA
jgi:hypothetical protein